MSFGSSFNSIWDKGMSYQFPRFSISYIIMFHNFHICPFFFYILQNSFTRLGNELLSEFSSLFSFCLEPFHRSYYELLEIPNPLKFCTSITHLSILHHKKILDFLLKLYAFHFILRFTGCRWARHPIEF